MPTTLSLVQNFLHRYPSQLCHHRIDGFIWWPSWSLSCHCLLLDDHKEYVKHHPWAQTHSLNNDVRDSDCHAEVNSRPDMRYSLVWMLTSVLQELPGSLLPFDSEPEAHPFAVSTIEQATTMNYCNIARTLMARYWSTLSQRGVSSPSTWIEVPQSWLLAKRAS